MMQREAQWRSMCGLVVHLNTNLFEVLRISPLLFVLEYLYLWFQLRRHLFYFEMRAYCP